MKSTNETKLIKYYKRLLKLKVLSDDNLYQFLKQDTVSIDRIASHLALHSHGKATNMV